MSRMARVNVYKQDAVRITTHLDDFAGTTDGWKNAVYEMFRWNMTWSFAHWIEVLESRIGGVYLTMMIKPSYEKVLVETMEGLGFRIFTIGHEDIGVIECTDLPDDMLVDFVLVNY